MSTLIETAPLEPARDTPPPEHNPSARGARLLSFLLVAGAVILYLPSLGNGFINFDDPGYISENSRVLQGLSWSNAIWAFTTTSQGNWHPLTWLSLMATAQVFGPRPLGFHLVNLVFHAVNVFLLFFLLTKATGLLARSATVAALFAVFPLNVEAVAWAAERKSVLSTTFLFLALVAYGWYARKPGSGRYVAVTLFFVLSLLVKSMMVTLPFALLLVDYWPLGRAAISVSEGRRWLKLAMEKIPLLAIAVADTAMAVYAGHRAAAITPLGSFPLGVRLNNAVFSYLMYVVKGLWPSHLAVLYPHPGHSLAWWKVIAGTAFLTATTAAVWHRREKRYLLAGWFWFLGTLMPINGIVQSGPQAMADRWAYVSFLGLFVMVVWLFADWAAKVGCPAPALAAATVAVLCAYAWVSHVQLRYWRDSYTLFSHTAAVTVRNAYAENALGLALEYDLQRPDLAFQHYAAAAGYAPRWPTAHYNYAVLLQAQNRLGDATREYGAAARFAPEWPTAHYNYAVMLQMQNRLAEAIPEYKQALIYEKNPIEGAQAHNNLGAIRLELNQLDAALAEFNLAIAADPAKPLYVFNRGRVEYQQRNFGAAARDFARAAKLAPSPQTYYWTGRAQQDQGDPKSAAASYEAALRMAPKLGDTENRLESVRRELHH
jgi:protein O-mannosyl-transferase